LQLWRGGVGLLDFGCRECFYRRFKKEEKDAYAPLQGMYGKRKEQSGKNQKEKSEVE
jgi:hypothetical protein